MTITLLHPVPGARSTDGFGWRPAIPGVVGAGHHNGHDWAADAGTLIRAAHAGRVSYVGWDNLGGGWMVKIDGPGYSTLYLHNREKSDLVSVGQAVTAGQHIARVGATGVGSGPHLHLILRVAGVEVDPLPHIARPTEPSGQEEDEDMEPRYVSDDVAKNPYWQITAAGKKRQVSGAEWAAIVAHGKARKAALIREGATKAEAEAVMPQVGQISTKQLNAIPTA